MKPDTTRLKTVTPVEVFDRAIALLRGDGEFGCPYCACADAKTDLDEERDDVDVVDFGEVVRQVLLNDWREMPEDAPLVETRDALRPYADEIGRCPSTMSRARMIEVLELARRSCVSQTRETDPA